MEKTVKTVQASIPSTKWVWKRVLGTSLALYQVKHKKCLPVNCRRNKSPGKAASFWLSLIRHLPFFAFPARPTKQFEAIDSFFFKNASFSARNKQRNSKYLEGKKEKVLEEMQVALSYQTWQELKEALQRHVREGFQSMETATDYFSGLIPFLCNLWRHTHKYVHLLPPSIPICIYVFSLYITYTIGCLNISKVQRSHSNSNQPTPALQ